jgi:hypothetical protein
VQPLQQRGGEGGARRGDSLRGGAEGLVVWLPGPPGAAAPAKGRADLPARPRLPLPSAPLAPRAQMWRASPAQKAAVLRLMRAHFASQRAQAAAARWRGVGRGLGLGALGGGQGLWARLCGLWGWLRRQGPKRVAEDGKGGAADGSAGQLLRQDGAADSPQCPAAEGPPPPPPPPPEGVLLAIGDGANDVAMLQVCVCVCLCVCVCVWGGAL